MLAYYLKALNLLHFKNAAQPQNILTVLFFKVLL